MSTEISNERIEQLYGHAKVLSSFTGTKDNIIVDIEQNHIEYIFVTTIFQTPLKKILAYCEENKLSYFINKSFYYDEWRFLIY
jgi:hypothetical protein